MQQFVILTLIGFVVGIINYWSLKKTINIMLALKNVYIMLVSFFIRTFAVLFVFYIFMDNSWKNVLFLLLGFVLSKIVSILLAKRNDNVMRKA